MAAKLTVAMVSTLRVPGKYNKPLLSDLGGDNPPLTLAYKFSRPSADLCGFLSSAWLTATHLAQHEVPGVQNFILFGFHGGILHALPVSTASGHQSEFLCATDPQTG